MARKRAIPLITEQCDIPRSSPGKRLQAASNYIQLRQRWLQLKAEHRPYEAWVPELLAALGRYIESPQEIQRMDQLREQYRHGERQQQLLPERRLLRSQLARLAADMHYYRYAAGHRPENGDPFVPLAYGDTKAEALAAARRVLERQANLATEPGT